MQRKLATVWEVGAHKMKQKFFFWGNYYAKFGNSSNVAEKKKHRSSI